MTAETNTASTFHDPRAATDEFETRTGSALGTPAYMSPEQAIGAVDKVDERSDVFGLGAILCEALTGKPPYFGADGESTRQLAAQAKLDDAHARLAVCGADPELVTLSKLCMNPDPACRPANAGEVAKSVGLIREAADERARKAELDRVRAEGERAKAEAEVKEQKKRRRVQLALAAAVGVMLIGGGAFAWQAETKARNERERRSRNADALAELLDRCETALREDDADRAEVALGQIDRRMKEGGGDGLTEREERCRKELALLRELDATDVFRWTPVQGKSPDDSTVVN